MVYSDLKRFTIQDVETFNTYDVYEIHKSPKDLQRGGGGSLQPRREPESASRCLPRAGQSIGNVAGWTPEGRSWLACGSDGENLIWDKSADFGVVGPTRARF
jgi:hypothetical protein